MSLSYWVEFWLAPVASILLVSLNPTPLSPILFGIGVLAWTLVEYIGHRFILHGLNTKANRVHHRTPLHKFEQISWPVWILFAPFILIPAFAAGLLFGYFEYILTHHRLHHDRQSVSNFLLSHHDGHHKNARVNFGVSTTVWDKLFGTRNG